MLTEGLTKQGEVAFASGGFAEVWKGTYRGRLVAIKCPRVYEVFKQEEIEILKKVRMIKKGRNRLLIAGPAILQGGCYLETVIALECFALPRCFRYDKPHFCYDFRMDAWGAHTAVCGRTSKGK
jgi:hypothetical protein